MKYIYIMTINGCDPMYASDNLEEIIKIGIEIQDKRWSERIRIYCNKPGVIYKEDERPYLNIKDAIDTSLEEIQKFFDEQKES